MHRGENHSFWHDDVRCRRIRPDNDCTKCCQFATTCMQTGQPSCRQRQAAPARVAIPPLGRLICGSGAGLHAMPSRCTVPQLSNPQLQTRDFLFFRSCACTAEVRGAEAWSHRCCKHSPLLWRLITAGSHDLTGAVCCSCGTIHRRKTDQAGLTLEDCLQPSQS